MKTSRQKILLACIAMLMAMVGDHLMGYNTGGFSDDGITMNVVSDLRYAASSLLGFLCMPLFAIAALELLKVMETKYKLQDKKLYKLFKFGNWSGILYFAFVHIGLCMLPVVYNAGMEATADPNVSMDMLLRVGKSILILMLRRIWQAHFLLMKLIDLMKSPVCSITWVKIRLKKSFIPLCAVYSS